MAAVDVAAPVAELAQVQQSVEGLTQGMEGVTMEQQGQDQEQEQGQGQMIMPELDLHRACAEGNLDGVRACLTASLESLEVVDIPTGCTPIVLAIRSSHYDVARELLSAGAIVPPPGLTADPAMLSILYPPHMYGMGMPQYMSPPDFYGQQQQQPHQGYQQPGAPFYPSHHQQHQQHSYQTGSGPGHQFPSSGFRERKGSRSEQANLPPTEVAKMIPCRNFPQCKYGNGCAFFHPNRPPFYAQGVTYGYEGYNGFQGGLAQSQEGQFQAQAQGSGATEAIPEGAEGSIEAAADVAAESNEQQVTVNGETAEQPSALPSDAQSQSQIQAQASYPIAYDPSQQYYPQAFYPRRQSFNQFPGAKPFGGKKPSFSGGPRPFAPRGAAAGGAPTAGDFGKWKDGVPPPCVFFGQGKCRNGEMCKFPHIDAEGKDCRNPDVINGSIPPITSTRPPPAPRAPRQSYGYPHAHAHLQAHTPHSAGIPTAPGPPVTYIDPAQRQQQLAFLQQQRAAVQNAQAGPTASNGSSTTAPANEERTVSPAGLDARADSANESSSNGETGTAMTDSQTLVASAADLKAVSIADSAVPVQGAESDVEKAKIAEVAASTTSLPAKPQNALPPSVGRSASRPGMPRPFHARAPFAPGAGTGTGVQQARRTGPGGSRAFGPGQANGRSASVEGQVRQRSNGAGNGSANANANGNGNAPKTPNVPAKQKVPGAADFPALGGSASGMSVASSKQASPVAGARTAAQVLSAPAPVKVDVPVVEKKEEKVEAEEIHMDSDTESDSVIITCKPASATGTAPASGKASPVKKAAPLSFASIAGAASSASSPAVDAAPVAVKA